MCSQTVAAALTVPAFYRIDVTIECMNSAIKKKKLPAQHKHQTAWKVGLPAVH